ncbi:carboxypeptidase-like regulatory domain-containing protein [Eubacterium sp. MSJ-13]|uniref:carboxypeptidase-like regulatory domain-containing protein n=1 Tax=Eubacterium sp. MSJ-13 TaxID=2841513 RepID=UPI001C120449|nr:carboxypeptidase-like regulatory domain-containing protein [Eubacterium sp. MSJ-13]MBU5477706.1 carboxypeptidase-like regulatory domain-containing protein [Eubacterium sp. MSJ-13]
MQNIITSQIKNNNFFSVVKFTLYTFISFILFILLTLYLPKTSYAKSQNTAAPKFQNKYGTIYIGNSYKYTIVNSPKNATIKFTINNKKLAKLNSKTGLLIPKKIGILTLKATFKSRNNRNNITLIKKITIKNKTSLNDNEELFSPPAHINSINFTIKLKSARILQQAQVENSYISLSKDTHLAKGNFKSLSDDGRYITYELNSSSIKLFSPGDGSMNGTYELACTLSKKRYPINYTEHMLGQSITGFVLDKSGKALEDALITITNNDITITAKTDINGYYIIRFPKAENISMSVSCQNYIPRYIDNISLKVTKSICKNIVLHTNNSKELSDSQPTAFFKITDSSKQPQKIEITTLEPDISHIASDKSDIVKKTFFTNNNGQLLLTANPNSTAILQTDADIINISENMKTISHINATALSTTSKDTFSFSYDENYCIKVYSSHNGAYILKNEFSFSFNDFISNNIIFNISLPDVEKTYYPEILLPITVGSNISYDKINYYYANLYRIGTKSPICSFSFCENTPADFKYQIDKLNLFLNDGNLYYAVFQVYEQYNKELCPPILYRFEVKNAKICFEVPKLEFNTNYTVDNKFPLLPSYQNTITDTSLLPQDTTCLNTILCSYNSYGNIHKTSFVSLSSKLLQYELLNSGNSYIIYTDNSELSTAAYTD